MGMGKTGLMLLVAGLLIMAAGFGIYFTQDAAAGIGVTVVGIVVLIASLLNCDGTKTARKIPIRTGEPPVGSQFLCPKCRAIVSVDDGSCPSCGKEFVDDAFQCPKCRSMVSMDSEECPNCNFLFVEKEYGVCPNCKEHIDVNAKECPYCGEKIWSALRPPMKLLACQSCRAPVKDTDEECPKCGFKIE